MLQQLAVTQRRQIGITALRAVEVEIRQRKKRRDSFIPLADGWILAFGHLQQMLLRPG